MIKSDAIKNIEVNQFQFFIHVVTGAWPFFGGVKCQTCILPLASWTEQWAQRGTRCVLAFLVCLQDKLHGEPWNDGSLKGMRAITGRDGDEVFWIFVSAWRGRSVATRILWSSILPLSSQQFIYRGTSRGKTKILPTFLCFVFVAPKIYNQAVFLHKLPHREQCVLLFKIRPVQGFAWT